MRILLLYVVTESDLNNPTAKITQRKNTKLYDLPTSAIFTKLNEIWNNQEVLITVLNQYHAVEKY